MKRRAIVFAALAGAAAVSAFTLKPRNRASQLMVRVDLESQVPSAFDGWVVDKGMVPVLPDPSLQSALDKIYAQVLARTYVNGSGSRVMLSIAYGEDQGSDATAAHRPEFCYTAQGFVVKSLGEAQVSLGGRTVEVRRLVGSLGPRVEPISYWVTLNDRAVLPGISRKLEQIRLGLGGEIPDGMLVRVSTIGLRQDESFSVQDGFLRSLEKALPVEARSRYFGGGTTKA